MFEADSDAYRDTCAFELWFNNTNGQTHIQWGRSDPRQEAVLERSGLQRVMFRRYEYSTTDRIDETQVFVEIQQEQSRLQQAWRKIMRAERDADHF